MYQLFKMGIPKWMYLHLAGVHKPSSSTIFCKGWIFFEAKVINSYEDLPKIRGFLS